MPREFPKWPTVSHSFRLFQRDGTWKKIHDALREKTRKKAGRKKSPGAAIIDRQTVKATGKRGSDAATTRGRRSTGGRRGDHIVVDTLGLLLAVTVYAANIQDRDGAGLVLELLKGKFPRLKKIRADGGYAGQLVGWVGRRGDRMGSGDRQAHRHPRRVCGGAQAVDRGENLRLVGPLPSPQQGLRATHRVPRGHDPHFHDQPHAPPPRAGITRLLRQALRPSWRVFNMRGGGMDGSMSWNALAYRSAPGASGTPLLFLLEVDFNAYRVNTYAPCVIRPPPSSPPLSMASSHSPSARRSAGGTSANSHANLAPAPPRSSGRSGGLSTPACLNDEKKGTSPTTAPTARARSCRNLSALSKRLRGSSVSCAMNWRTSRMGSRSPLCTARSPAALREPGVISTSW